MRKCLHRHAVFSSLPRLRFNVPVVVWLPVATTTATAGFSPGAAACDWRARRNLPFRSVAGFLLRQRPEPLFNIPLRAAPHS